MYKLDIDPDARDQLNAVPAGELNTLAEVFAMLELTPWNGQPHPDGAVRRVLFGDWGIVVYLILEDQRRVDVLQVVWAG
jgi:hypothetical protein